MVDGKAVIDPDKCTECGTCIGECPVEAIVEE
jgi:NAD-dependent dihydropyrimidine dehydrogenase PreA subunit